MGISKIRDYGMYKGVPIARDYNVYGDQVFLGLGENCGTFWFKNVKEARRFIDHYEERIIPDAHGLGLIPEEMCEECRHKNHRPCEALKSELKALVR